MVAPAGFLSIAMTRACLVSGPAAGLDDADADRLRDTGLAVFRAVDRAVAFGLDLDLFMGSSEVCATPSAAPPQPARVNHPAGLDPEAGLSRPKSPQQRSNQARKPVNSEQDSCSLFSASVVQMVAENGECKHRLGDPPWLYFLFESRPSPCRTHGTTAAQPDRQIPAGALEGAEADRRRAAPAGCGGDRDRQRAGDGKPRDWAGDAEQVDNVNLIQLTSAT
jgi:hypothetical protein